jgi:hypothetical protein
MHPGARPKRPVSGGEGLHLLLVADQHVMRRDPLALEDAGEVLLIELGADEQQHAALGEQPDQILEVL